MAEERVQSLQAVRSKTQLACDTCRRRKSRCDGLRPTCTHCRIAGAICSYRPAIQDPGANAAILSRLDAIEARLDAAEHHPQPTARGQDTESLTYPDRPVIPEFHHGAGHKVLQYWSRLRVKLTIPDVDVLQYLKAAEQESPLLEPPLGSLDSFDLPWFSVESRLQHIFEHSLILPISLSILITHCSVFSIDSFFRNISSSPGEEPMLRVRNLSIEELLLLALAHHYSLQHSSETENVAEWYFSLALQRLWRLYNEADEVTIPLMLMFANVFLYVSAKPFHALGLLQSIDPGINRILQVADMTDSSAERMSEVYFLLQSDILTEVDGVPSPRVPEVLEQLDINHPFFERVRSSPFEFSPSNGQHSKATTPHAPASLPSLQNALPNEFFCATSLWLRAHLNRVLRCMFTTEQAYCEPREVGPIVVGMTSQLDLWYRHLPLEYQFVRDSRTFRLRMPCVIQSPLVELALRYFACVCFLNRPVLYSVLYQDLGHPTPPDVSGYDAERYFEPWILSSCRDCIESAKLIIFYLANRRIEGSVPINWTEIQLLTGSYAVLLSVQTASSFSAAFRETVQIGEILDMAEEVLAGTSQGSVGYQRLLDILTNIRHNFINTTPLAI